MVYKCGELLGTPWETHWELGEHVENPLRTWCEFIENLTWTHMIHNYHIQHCVLIGPLPNWPLPSLGPTPPPFPPKLTCKKGTLQRERHFKGNNLSQWRAIFWGSYAEGAALEWNKALIKVFLLKLFHVNLDVQPIKKKFSTLFHVMQKLLWNPEKMEPFFNCLITCLLLEKAKGILNPVKRQNFLSHIYHMYFVEQRRLSCSQKDTQVECSFY